MAIAVGSSSFVASTTTRLNVARPSGTVNGDLLVAVHWLDNDGSLYSMSAPAGWTLQASIGNNTHIYAKIWTHPVTDLLTEPAQYTFGGTSIADGIVTIVRLTGITNLSSVTIWAALQMGGTASPHLTPAAPLNDTDNTAIIFAGGVVAAPNTWGIPGTYTNRGPSLTTQTGWGQGVVASRSGLAGGIQGAQSITTTAFSTTGTYGDVTGVVVIGQSAGNAAAVNAVITAGATVTATLSSSIFPIQKYTYSVDWQGDGSFTGTGNDVSLRVTSDDAVSIEYGRDQARALAPIKPGGMSFTLTNETGDYYPDKPTSPLFGNLNPARPNLVTVLWQGVSYTLWRGHLDDYTIDTTPGRKTLSMTAVDPLSDLDASVYTPLYRGVRSGAVVNYILDAIGWPSGKRDIDPGVSVFPYWWEEGTGAWEALQKVVQSEGPPAFVTIDSLGNIVFRDRHHRFLDTPSNTVQATWRSNGADPRFSRPLVYNSGWRDIINVVTFSVPDREPSNMGVVWETDATFNLAANAAVSVIAVGQEPFMNAQRPTTNDGDYTLNFGSVEVTLSRDSGQSVQILMRETAGSTAMVTGMKLRANALPAPTSTQVTSSDAVSIGTYSVKTYPNEAPWAGQYDAQAIADTIVAMRKDRVPTMQVTFTGGNSTILTEQFKRNLSDRVTVVDSETGFNGDVFVEQIRHSITGAGNRVHVTTFGVEKVPTALDNPSTVFIFGSSTNGKFGTNVFGH